MNDSTGEKITSQVPERDRISVNSNHVNSHVRGQGNSL